MSKSRRTGTRGEVLAVEYLAADLGPQVERRAQQGAADRGDIAGVAGTAIEIKWCAKIDLGNWMKEAETEARRCGPGTLPVLMHNRRQASAGDNYATVPWWVLRYFLRLHLDDVARRAGAA